MPAIGHFVLHSHFMPTITAGRYTLKSEHRGLPFPVAPETTHLHVAAPRYTMPTEQILSSFPPANAEGAFGDRLPQIVLKRRTLPWERNPVPSASPSADGTPWLALVVVAEGEASLSTAAPVADCVTAGTVLHQPQDHDVEQGLYLAVTESVVKKIFPTRQDLPLLTHVRQVDVADTELASGDDDGWLAVVLANRLPVFDAAGGKPVRYMACLLNVEGQLDALPAPAPAVDNFTWGLAQDWSVLSTLGTQVHADSMVMGQASVNASQLPPKFGALNAVAPSAPQAKAAAMPQAGASALIGGNSTPLMQGALDGGQALVQPAVATQWGKAGAAAANTANAAANTPAHIAQQVSQAALNPDAQRMVRDTMGLGFRFPIEQYAHLVLEKVLRFPVLAHWSFTTSEGATFETLMQDLDVGLLGTLPPLPQRKPGQPEPAPRPKNEPEVVATGHIGLAHRARRGDAVAAWYRGPCVPFATPRNGGEGASATQPLPLAHAADQLRRVVPDGREDLTLASAFEMGRLLALSQLSVVSALLRFRGEQFGAGRVREQLIHVMPFPLPGLKANAGPLAVDLGRFTAVQTVHVLAKNSERMLGPQRPVADPGREIKVDGDIDRLIATGLGLDHERLVKRGSQIGMLAALQATAVPLAGALGAGQFGEREFAALSDALTTELNRTLAVARPTAVVVKPSGPRRRGAAAGTQAATADALDALIANVRLDADDDVDAEADADADADAEAEADENSAAHREPQR